MGLLDRHVGKPTCPAKAGDLWRALCMREDHIIRRWGWQSWFIAGVIFAFSDQFKVTAFHDLMILAIAIYAGSWFFRLRNKLRLTNNSFVKSILSLIFILLLSGFVIGLLTPLLNLVIFYSPFRNLLP